MSIAIIQLTAALVFTGSGSYTPSQLATWIADASTTHQIDPWLHLALGKHEGDFLETARSPVGAIGPWQLMPEFWGAHPLRLCRMQPRHCGWWHAYYAAKAIKHWSTRCPGMARTVRAYRSGTPHGRCLAPREKDWQVVRLRNRLKREFGEVRS